MNKIGIIVSIQPVGDLVLITLKDGVQLTIPLSEFYQRQLQMYDTVLYSTDDEDV